MYTYLTQLTGCCFMLLGSTYSSVQLWIVILSTVVAVIPSTTLL